MRILIRADTTFTDARLTRLSARLASVPGAAEPTVLRVPRLNPAPAALDLLLQLERMLLRGQPPPDAAPPPGQQSLDVAADVVVDLAADAVAPLDGGLRHGDTRHLQVLYDGVADPLAVYAALLDGQPPVVDVADARSGVVLARGRPCADNASDMAGAADFVFARIGALIEMALVRPGTFRPLPPGSSARLSGRRVAAIEMRRLAAAVVRRLYRLCCYDPHWQIGWRHVDGPGVLENGDLSGPQWRVLADDGVRFYADPFPFHHRGRDYIFFEDLDHRLQKGIISYVEIGPDGPIGPVRPVLEEAWHLSYPFMIEQGGEVYMIPEASANREVPIYRAQPFPDRWVKEGVLISGPELGDATAIEHQGHWYIMGSLREDGGSYSDTLAIYVADRLMGPWRPHPDNPVLVDVHAARPAGPFVRKNGRLWRVTQSCAAGYGTALGLAEVTRLDPDGFEQELRSLIRNGPNWPGRRLHTLARAGRLECIDGSGHAPRARLVAGLMPARSGRHAGALTSSV